MIKALIIVLAVGIVTLGLRVKQCHPGPESHPESVPAEQESLNVYRIEEILVTASRLPPDKGLFFSNVSIASKADLVELSSSTLGEALAFDPGVNLIGYGSSGALQTLALRGGSAGEVVFLLDGVPISDAQLGVIDLRLRCSKWGSKCGLAGCAAGSAVKRDNCAFREF
jgi:hypothetical protein